MKPTFALDLSRDTIALLHRNPKGWLSIGEVAFDTPDLDAALDYLRKTALGLSPMGMACKVILPNSQILYTEVTAPGPSRNDKRRQIAAALEGRTPYAVDDLVFDWSGKGATVKVAVVARETLDEAEGFAATHRLNPVSFVAVPPDGSFVGEAWFGPTTLAESLLAPGEMVDRDREPVTILHRELPGALPATQDEVATEAPVSMPVTPLAESDPSTPPELQEALALDPSPQDPVPESPPEPEPAPSVEPAPADVSAPVVVSEVTDDGSPRADTSPEPEFQPKAEAPEAPSPKVTATEVEEAPFAHVFDASPFPDDEDAAPLAAGSAPAPADDDLPPAPSAAAIAAFASRRSSDPAISRPAALPASGGKAAPRPGQPIPRPVPPKTFAGSITAPSIPGTRAKPRGKVQVGETGAAMLGAPTTVKSPARPGGTFGTAAPPRNRTGVVFMVLVALLLVFLAVIAAWSSMWLSQNGAVQEDVSQTIEAPLPGVDDEMLADMQDPEGMTAPLPEAADARPVDVGALATEEVPIDLALGEPLQEGEGTPGDDAAAAPLEDTVAVVDDPVALDATRQDTAATEPALASGAQQSPAVIPAPVAAPSVETAAAVPPEPVTEPAPETTITTDVSAAQAPVEDQDEIFLAAMDAPPPALDALALPVPAVVVDTAPDAAMPPPAFGTVYRFDANGLVVPTPDGILSPDGVFLVAGAPPRVPPPRSEVATAAALAAAPVVPDVAQDSDAVPTTGDASLVTATEAPLAEPAPSDPAMAGFRPRPRPEGLAPATEDDAAIATDSPTAVVGLRPLARPESVITLAAASRPVEPADLGAQAASLAAQAAAELAAAAALEAQNPSVVAISRRPEARPRDLSRAVEAAVAAAVRAPEPQPEPEPEVVVAAAAAPTPAPEPEAAPQLKPEELDEVDEPATSNAAPKIPTRASVAKQATFKNAINLSKVNLIGTYGTDSKRYALIRQSNGRYKKVKVGDKIDGGTVKAITATEVRYQKGGKLLTLAMPKA